VSLGYVDGWSAEAFSMTAHNLVAASGEVLFYEGEDTPTEIGSTGEDLYLVAGAANSDLWLCAVIDVDYVRHAIAVTANGTTPVQIVHPESKKWLSCNSAICITNGASNSSVIYVSSKSTAGTPAPSDHTQLCVPVGENYAIAPITICPVNEVWLIPSVHFTCDKTSSAEFRIYTTSDIAGIGSYVEYKLGEWYMYQNSGTVPFDPALQIKAKERMRFTLKNNGGASINATVMFTMTTFNIDRQQHPGANWLTLD
jgi:hypothetical protein